MRIKIQDIVLLIIVLFSWLGLFSYFVSSILGGDIYILAFLILLYWPISSQRYVWMEKINHYFVA